MPIVHLIYNPGTIYHPRGKIIWSAFAILPHYVVLNVSISTTTWQWVCYIHFTYRIGWILPCLCAICDWSLPCSVDGHSKVTFGWALQTQYSRSLNVAITSDLGDLRILVYRRTLPLLFLFAMPIVILFLRCDSGRRKSTVGPYSLIAHLDPIVYEWLYEGSVVGIVLRLCNCSQSDHPGIWLCSSVYVISILMSYRLCGYLVAIPPGCDSALLPRYSFTFEVLHMWHVSMQWGDKAWLLGRRDWVVDPHCAILSLSLFRTFMP